MSTQKTVSYQLHLSFEKGRFSAQHGNVRCRQGHFGASTIPSSLATQQRNNALNMNYTRGQNPNSSRHQSSHLKGAFALALLGAGLNGQPAEAAAYKIGWLDLSTAGPVNSSVASGSTFHLPGYAGMVTFTYTSPSSLNWIRDTYQPAYDGIITPAGASYGWTYVDYLGAVDYNASPSAIDYILTFTFSPPVPANQLVLASIGLRGAFGHRQERSHRAGHRNVSW
jgi:hypothetical protein